MTRRVKAASFREPKTLEDFDFTFNPSVKRKRIFDLATCKFVRDADDVLLLGPPGTGKSHLVQALGYQAIKAGHTVLYPIIKPPAFISRTIPSERSRIGITYNKEADFKSDRLLAPPQRDA